jgi:hypothetical protein
MVDSAGGTGRQKHWGSPFGCQSVAHAIDVGSGEYIGPLAAYVFGNPLPAEEVIAREWCSRCLRAAHDFRTNAASKGESATELASVRGKTYVRRLAHALADYYGER